ncbi:hypothetical protein ACJX0J_024005 [Zea mays]
MFFSFSNTIFLLFVSSIIFFSLKGINLGIHEINNLGMHKKNILTVTKSFREKKKNILLLTMLPVVARLTLDLQATAGIGVVYCFKRDTQTEIIENIYHPDEFCKHTKQTLNKLKFTISGNIYVIGRVELYIVRMGVPILSMVRVPWCLVFIGHMGLQYMGLDILNIHSMLTHLILKN